MSSRFSGVTINPGGFEAKFVFPTALKTGVNNFRKSDVKSHMHFDSEVHFILDGEGVLSTCGKEYVLKKNSICIIPRGITHDSLVTENGSRIFNMLISFKTPRKKKSVGNYRLMYSWNSITDLLVFENCSRICDYVQDLLQADDNEQLIKSLMTVIFLKLSERVESVYPGQSKVAKACEIHYDGAFFDVELENFLMLNYKSKLTREEVAVHLGISAVQLSRTIRKNYGMNYCELITTLRMTDAASKLSSDCAITEIAKSLGYTTYNGFAAAFRRKYGVSPENYRNNLKEKKQ